MDEIYLYLDLLTMQIVIVEKDKEITRMPIGIAYWLKKTLPVDSYLKVRSSK